jgi:hypothetical protein
MEAPMSEEGELVQIPVTYTLNEEGFPTSAQFTWPANVTCQFVDGFRFVQGQGTGVMTVRVPPGTDMAAYFHVISPLRQTGEISASILKDAFDRQGWKEI